MHRRRSIRLQDYDYSQNGAYFVTICAHNRMRLFGDVMNDEVLLNDWGVVLQTCWDAIPAHYPMVELDAFVIMPNHVHGIVVIVGNDHPGTTHASPLRASGPKPNSLGAIVGQFKSAVTRRINRLHDRIQHPVWQRNYYEHIIRSEASLNDLRAYIATNPARWAQDELFM